MEETIAQEAKRLLETVPAEEWVESLYSDRNGKCCALGHFNRLKSKAPDDYSISNCWDDIGKPSNRLRDASLDFIFIKHDKVADIASVNNVDYVNGYTEPAIKDRVIHLLNDMIEGGY